ncbi:MAG: FxLYD domain-containing protein [Anaerolineae bacterium]
MTRFFIGLVWLISLSACSGGAVIFAPTPLPPEASPNQYDHPSGAFTLLLPRTWALYEQTTSLFASASFAPPASDTPLVQIAVVNLGREITAGEIGELMTRYQTDIRPDIPRYTEQDRQAMGDGSWRIAGLRQTISGSTEQVNTFIQYRGSLLSVMEVIVPLDATLQSQTQTIINTYQLATDADLPVANLSDLTGTASAPIQLVNVSTWTTANGVFYVTGELANADEEALAELPVQAQLLTDAGEVVAEGGDIVMGYAVEPGGFAPFSLRFGQGQPVNATRYAVTIGAESYTRQPVTVIGAPILQWEDATDTNRDAAIFITGTVTNTGDVDVLAPRAIATLFDAGGRVIGAGFANADVTQLGAGETADFNVLISEVGGVPVNYVVNVQALPCDASCE